MKKLILNHIFITFITNQMACVQKVQENAMKVLYDSGKFFEQFGLYEKCAEDQLKYSLTLLGPSATKKYSGLYIGLCLPNECD